jgi:hypothetical protein
MEVVRKHCRSFEHTGTPRYRAELLSDSDYAIVSHYQAEYRGIVNYYLLAQNVSQFAKLHWVMETSLLHTLASKHQTTVMAMVQKYKSTIPTAYGPKPCLKVVVPRGSEKPPLVAVFGGIPLRRQKTAILVDRHPRPYRNERSDLLQRLLANACELCGTRAPCEVHHIRKLADLKVKGRAEKPTWVIRMAARQRKTMVVCQACHRAIHAGTLT